VNGWNSVTVQILAGALAAFSDELISLGDEDAHRFNLIPGAINLILGIISVSLCFTDEVETVDAVCAWLTILIAITDIV